MLAALVLGLAIPTFAVAQFGPQNVPGGLTATQPADEEVPEEDTGGLSTFQLVLIFGAAVGIVAAIGLVIMRDARRAAPAEPRASARAPRATGAGGGGPKNAATRERERQKARKRGKAKAARDQRKRNRPR